jgi:hypothetical protein
LLLLFDIQRLRECGISHSPITVLYPFLNLCRWRIKRPEFLRNASPALNDIYLKSIFLLGASKLEIFLYDHTHKAMLCKV